MHPTPAPLRFLAAALCSALLTALLSPAAQAETLKVLTTGAFKQAVVAMVPAFEAHTGHTVVVDNDTAGAVARRVEQGEAFDLLVLTPGALQPLEAAGKVLPGSSVPLARVAIGVAVPAGAPLPDISTTERFVDAVKSARRVAYIDPASGGSSGIYLQRLFERLGIADAVAPKAVLVPGGLVATRLVSGEADLAIHQVSEILPVAGVQLVGPLPDAIQNYTTYAGAVSSASPRPQAAQALLDALSGTEAREVLRAKGMMAVR